MDVDRWLDLADLGLPPQQDFAISDSESIAGVDNSRTWHCETRFEAEGAFRRVNQIIEATTDSLDDIAKHTLDPSHDFQDATVSAADHEFRILDTDVPIICNEESGLCDPTLLDDDIGFDFDVSEPDDTGGTAESATVDITSETLKAAHGPRVLPEDLTSDISRPPKDPTLSSFETALIIGSNSTLCLEKDTANSSKFYSWSAI